MEITTKKMKAIITNLTKDFQKCYKVVIEKRQNSCSFLERLSLIAQFFSKLRTVTGKRTPHFAIQSQ